MAITACRVGIVGGSIAGCSAAIALQRAGCDVTVYERSTRELEDRGLGIGMPVPAHRQLVAAGYIDADMPVLRWRERICVTLDESADDREREVFRHPFDAVVNNWGLLWRNLRAKVPDDVYRHSTSVREVVPDAEGATIVTDTGRERFDVVVGADGYRSATRAHVDASASPKYAGYVLWRGTYPEELLDHPMPDAMEQGAVWVGMPRGHGVFYLIPDLVPGRREVNWGVYGFVPWDRFEHPTSLPPGSVGDEYVEVLEQHLSDVPPGWAKLIRATPRQNLALQPVYDTPLDSYRSGRILLVGDAATVARPHSGAGATKALQDALALERVCLENDTWEQALTAYDRERRPAGNEIVHLGRRLGKAQVEQPPTWATMTTETYREWMSRTMIVTPYES